MRMAVVMLILSLVVPSFAGADDNASLEKMRQTAEQGNVEAQLEIGILYEFGFNMPKNNVTALAWYLRAAEQGNALAVKRRDLLKSRMTPDEIDAAQKLSSELIAKKSGTAETPPAATPVEEKPPSSEKPSTSP